MSDQRKARLNELVKQRRYSAALDEAAHELAGLGLTVDRSDAVTKEAVAAALVCAEQQTRFQLVWHRGWGVRLRSEFIDTTRRLADLLADEEATLIWQHWPSVPAYPRTSIHVGFVVSVASTLRSLPEHLGPGPSGSGPGGIGPILLVSGDEHESGLRVAYTHYGDADEYEIRPWGRYAMPVI